MVDSGNTLSSGVAISKEFAQELGIRAQGKQFPVGTAAEGKKMRCMGVGDSLQLVVRGLLEGVVKPQVIEGMSHPLNLGSQFLKTHKLSLDFSSNPPLLRSQERQAEMINFLTSQWSKVEEEQPGKEPSNPSRDEPTKKSLHLKGKEKRLRTRKEVYLEPQTCVQVPVVREKEGKYLVTAQIQPGQGVFVAPGVYQEPKVMMYNHTDQRVRLRRGTEVGIVQSVQEARQTRLEGLREETAVQALKEEVLRLGEEEGREGLPPQADEEDLKEVHDLYNALELEKNPLLQQHPEIYSKLRQLIYRYRDIFSSESQTHGETDLVECDLKIKEGQEPIRQRVRPLNPIMEENLKKQLDQWAKEGIVQKSKSPWASPLVPVLKKCGSIRWATDFRQVNRCIEPDAYPLPNITDTLNKLSGSKIFSSLDAAQAYHTIRMSPRSRKVTAICTPLGLYEFLRMPFGLSVSGAVYSRYVALAMDGVNPKNQICYLDDILVHSSKPSEHLQHLEEAFEAHRAAGLKLKASKTHLFKDQVVFLGHLVTKDGLKMVPDYLRRISEWPTPRTVKELNTTLGFFSYYRSYIVNYSLYTCEMDAQKKAKKLEWTPVMEQKFKELKEAFQKAGIRGYPQYGGEKFILTTDYSHHGLSAVLSQVQGGKERMLCAASRKASKFEVNYSSMKGEACAVVYGLRKYRHMLLMRPFIVYTDSQALKYLHNLKEPRGIWMRWLEEMAAFQMQVQHKPGKTNLNADGLSRTPGMMQEPTQAEEDEEKEFIGAVLDQDLSRELLREEQGKDLVLKKVRKWMQRGAPSRAEMKGEGLEAHMYWQIWQALKMTSDGLMVFPFKLNRPPEGQIERILVPESMKDRVFYHTHHHRSAGHFGVQATIARAQRRFYWPGHTAELRKAVLTCDSCVRKIQKTSPRSHGHQPLRTGFPFQVMSIDLVGPLTETNKGHKYILTCQDTYSRYVMAFPIPNKETATVARMFVDRVICQYGAPIELKSDRGREFTGNIFREVLQMLGIRRVNTPPYNPQSNPVERWHRTLGAMFRVFMEREDRAWEEHLATACLAYNTKINQVTGLTPYFIVYGREARLPLDLMIKLPREEDLEVSDFVKQTRRRFQSMVEYIRAQGEAQILRNAMVYEGNPDEWKPGNQVYYYTPRSVPGKSKKLTSSWLGPFTITRKVAPVLLGIKPSNQEGPERIVHISRLKPYHGSGGRTQLTPRQLDVDDEGDEEGELIAPPRPTPAPMELGVPIQMGTPAAEIVDGPSQGQDPLEEEMGGPAPLAALPEEEDQAMTEAEGRTITGAEVPPEVTPDQGTPRAEGTPEKEQGEGTMATDESLPVRKSSFPLRRRRRQPDTDTSTDRAPKRTPKKSKKIWQRARELDISSSEATTSEEEMHLLHPATASLPVQILAGSTKPVLGTPQSAGYDLQAPVTRSLAPGSVTRVELALQLAIPPGYFGWVATRSSTAIRGLIVVGGIIDADYRGKVSVILSNTSRKKIQIRRRQKIAQLIILQHVQAKWVHTHTLPESYRGNHGFGSTNRNLFN